MPGYFSAVADAIASKTTAAKKAVADTAASIKHYGIDHLAKKQSAALKEAQELMTPAERQRSYDTARKSILGDFSSDPISGCQECMASAKAIRRKHRLDLVNRAVLCCPGDLEAAQRLRQYTDEVEYMRCAKHIYLANDPDAPADLRDNPPPGFRMATKSELAEAGLSEKMLTPEGSQFKAAVYMKDNAVWGPDPKPPGLVVFRGSTPEKEDWDNNFAQGTNSYSPYYERAVHIGNRLAASESTLRLVGHSLAGGLASAAQGGSGLEASTYNAAGLRSETVARYSRDKDHMKAQAEKISAFRVRGELLTKTQESLIGSKGISAFSASAVGTKYDLDAAHDDGHFEKYDKVKANKDDAYDAYLHGMDQVIAATEKQKQEDEQTLVNCVAAHQWSANHF